MFLYLDAKAGGVKPIRRGTMMHPDEALKVLNIEKSNMNKKAIEEVCFSINYEKYFLICIFEAI